MILDPPNVRANLKKSTTNRFSSFSDLFFIRKSIRVNPTDNEILFQVLKKVKALTKVFIEQSEHIKQLEKKIKSSQISQKRQTKDQLLD